MPAEGVPLASRFSEGQIKAMYEGLRQRGEPLGLKFGDVKITPNSRMSLEASEFARDNGLFHLFHERVFRAFFTETRDIGRVEVILDCAREVGLDENELKEALDRGRYIPRLAEARKEGEKLGVTAVPTFFLNGGTRIVGVQSLDFFRERLKEAEDSRTD